MSLLEEGQTFARYRVIHNMGSSVSGDCYEAEDIELQHKVALKLIHPWSELSDIAKYQFIREMQHISTITHPRLAEMFDYGEIAGQLYMTRRYIATGSLLSSEGRRLFPTPLPLMDSVKYTYQLAHTLYYLHMHDYVHGSLVLTNILVRDESYGEYEQHISPFVITDAGTAHFVRRFGQRQQGILPVTAAPEQFDNYVSPATDQYALAVLLYLWLTGQPPFLGSIEETRHAKLSETFPAPSTLRADITSEQENILRKALRVYPDERYPSIIGFAEALLATLVVQPQSLQEQIQPPDPLPPTGPDVPQPMPGREPTPEQIPDPEPIPTPDSTPEVAPNPAQEPLPEPAPDVPPKIEPDIAQPLPEPGPIPNPTEPSTEPRMLLRPPQSSDAQTIALTQNETTLGRAESNTIVLDQDTSTSRRHAIIRREQNNFVIYDWDSINGVIVNGQRLASDTGHILQNGDILSIGEYTLMFQAPAAPVEKSTVTTTANNASQTQSAQLQAH